VTPVICWHIFIQHRKSLRATERCIKRADADNLQKIRLFITNSRSLAVPVARYHNEVKQTGKIRLPFDCDLWRYVNLFWLIETLSVDHEMEVLTTRDVIKRLSRTQAVAGRSITHSILKCKSATALLICRVVVDDHSRFCFSRLQPILQLVVWLDMWLPSRTTTFSWHDYWATGIGLRLVRM